MNDRSTNSAPQNICDLFTYFIYITPTSFAGSLFFPSLEREKGREEERPWERGWHNTRVPNVYNLINQDLEVLDLVSRFSFSKLSYRIACSLT